MNRGRAETHLRLLAEEELRRAMTRLWDGTAGSQPDDDAVRSASVTGTLAGGAAGPDALMASRGGSSADRAVTELYAMQYRSLVRLAALLVRDVQTAEEVVQDSFAAMHRGWQQLRDADAALAFLRQAVVNRSRSVLRHRPVPGSSLRQLPPGVSGEHRARVARVARALIAVGALDGEVAEQILVDFELALATRQAGSPGQRGPGLGSWMRSSPVGRRVTIWIRDSGGHWHATRTRGRSGIGGEIALRLQVLPPLSHATTWIEVLAAGQSAEARTTLPLRWQ